MIGIYRYLALCGADLMHFTIRICTVVVTGLCGIWYYFY
jgi:hypothetical protein